MEDEDTIDLRGRSLLLVKMYQRLHKLGNNGTFSVGYYEGPLTGYPSPFNMFLAAIVPKNGKILDVCYNYH